jgi:AraC-like DNA-binding protein
MKATTPGEYSKLWRLPHLEGVELLRAHYVTQTFSRHAHEGFAVGVIESGALGFVYRGENVVAPAGAINLAIPDEPHTGHAALESGWSYRMFYLDAGLLRQAAAEISGKPHGMPYFRPGVLFDEDLAQSLRGLHVALELETAYTLEHQSRLLSILTQFIRRHAHRAPAMGPVRREHQAVARARDYLESHYADNPSLQQLAAAAYLSPFHLIRVFQYELGLSPHAYLTQVRVRHARSLLAQGQPIVSVANATGFSDQSHLTRHFKRILGVTPGQYRNFVQDRRVAKA